MDAPLITCTQHTLHQFETRAPTPHVMTRGVKSKNCSGGRDRCLPLPLRQEAYTYCCRLRYQPLDSEFRLADS